MPDDRALPVICPITVLRPEPGNMKTIARLKALGLEALALPLFAVRRLAWTVPDPTGFDALILTSANAVRWAGDALAQLRALPVAAVGEATAAAARTAGFDVMIAGSENAQALLTMAQQMEIRRALHLGGRESIITPGSIVRQTIAVYASDPVVVPPEALAGLVDGIALLHSPRAASRLCGLIDATGFPKDRIILAALSPAIARAAGTGWRAIWTARLPDDAALVQLVCESMRTND